MKKHLFLKSLLVLIGVLITSLTNQAWATTFNGGNIFVNASGWDLTSYPKVYLAVGKSDYLEAKGTSQVPGSKWYKWYSSSSSDWSGYTYMMVIATSGSPSNWASSGDHEAYYYASQSGQYSGTNSSTNFYHTHNYTLDVGTGNGNLTTGEDKAPDNTTQTVSIQIDGSNATVSPATVRIDAYKYESLWSTAVNSTSNGSSFSQSINVSSITTGTTTLTVSSVGASYHFEGFYTSGGDLIDETIESSGTYTYTYQADAATTIYAKFISVYSGLTASASPAAAASAGYPTISANYVAQGSTVDVEAGTPQTGYSWDKWTSSNGSFGTVTDASTTFQPSALNAVAVANFTENKSLITITAGTGGSVTTGAGTDVALGIDTDRDIVATADDGYYFTGWTVNDGGHAVVDDPSSSTTKARTDGFDGGTGTITANFASRFAVIGSAKLGGNPTYGMPGWSDHTQTLDYVAENDFERSFSLKGNTQYKFRLRDLYYDNDSHNLGFEYVGSDMTLNSTGNCWLNHYNQDVTFTLDGSDEITFKAIGFADGYKVNLQLKTSDSKTDYYTATFGCKTVFGDESEDASEGGSVSAKDWKNFDLLTTEKVKKGTNVVFTATPTPGYELEGWYNNADYAAGHKISTGGDYVVGDNTLTVTFSGNKAVYAKFVEKMTTVNLAAENGTIKLEGETDSWSDVTSIQAGVHTNPHIKPVPAEGYFFTGWVRTAGSDYELQDGTGGAKAFETEADSIVYLVGRGDGATSGQTLTAKFEKLEKIYFKNYFSDGSTTTRWSQVYVYFDISWGTGGDANRAITSDKAYYKKAMTKLDDTDIYWAFVPRSVTTGNLSKVAFSDASMTTSYKFYSSGSRIYAATRGDYGAHLNMFVPYHVAKHTNLGNVDYFDNGYWRNYGLEAGEEAGYTMRLRTGSDTYRTMGEFLATENPDIIKYRYRLDTITHTQFMVQSAGNLKYKTKSDAVVTISACNDVLMSEHTSSDGKFTLTPNRLGYYVITIDQSGDEMKMSVNYPLAVGDYILEHTYVNESGTTIKTHSDVIKYDSAANVTRYSMFLSKSKEGSTSTLKLRQCTNAATQTWTEGYDTNLSSILTQLASDGNGVYQFDLSVDKTNNRVDAVVTDSTRLYTGKYYIKTDSITGGWINYKRNALEHNTLTFKASNPNSFDYYYCKFFYPIGGSGANPGKIKCVIANDYCNAVSDTLFGDEIATGSDPTVPSYTTYKGTSIRFSYNSTTNQLKRTYLGASANDYYLDLKVSTDNMVYKDNSPDDDINLFTTTYDNTWANRCRFEDTEDWVYEKVVKVIPGGKGGIVAKFDATTQELLETDHLLLGCQDGGTCTAKYDIRLVYDFKTNYLMASWIPGGPVSEKLENVDMLWERVADNSAQQISFSDDGSLKKVKVVGAIRFDYDSVYHSPSGKPHWTDLSTWSPASRRWLKYFVSFPFDVPVSSVFGLAGAELGRDYIIQKYNGDKRAKEGLYFGDGGNFWENLTKDSIMHANEGYCVIFDNDYARGWYGSWWNHKKSGSHVYLYFPAKDTIASITGEDKEVTVAKHKCNINRYFYELEDEYKLTKKNHIQTDSHWNLIGTPQFHDAYIKSQKTDTTGLNLAAYYYLDYSDNKWKVQSIAAKPVFKAMHSYWVQWAGTIKWTTDPEQSAFGAPARNQKQARKLSMKLNLMYNGKATDWTYLEMAENADEDFKLCEDLCKVYNQNSTHIYTYAGDYDVAYNKLPIAGRTVNVGVDIYRNGTYTFAMPDNFDGVVILVDNVTETRTNLAAGNYEVYLNKGTYKSRFSLEIGVNSTPTEINDVQDAQGTKARKMMIDGVLYIVKDGKVFDARGNRVR